MFDHNSINHAAEFELSEITSQLITMYPRTFEKLMP